MTKEKIKSVRMGCGAVVSRRGNRVCINGRPLRLRPGYTWRRVGERLLKDVQKANSVCPHFCSFFVKGIHFQDRLPVVAGGSGYGNTPRQIRRVAKMFMQR